MLSGLEELILFGFLPLTIGVLVWPASPGSERTVAGRIVIPPHRSLPDGAVATVELVEQRRGESFSPVVARETMRWRGPEAQKFAIRFDPNFIRPMAYYALQARVIAGGTVLFESQYPQPAAPLGGDPVTLTLVQPATRA